MAPGIKPDASSFTRQGRCFTRCPSGKGGRVPRLPPGAFLLVKQMEHKHRKLKHKIPVPWKFKKKKKKGHWLLPQRIKKMSLKTLWKLNRLRWSQDSITLFGWKKQIFPPTILKGRWRLQVLSAASINRTSQCWQTSAISLLECFKKSSVKTWL